MENLDIGALLRSFGARVPYSIYSELNKELDITKYLMKHGIKGEKYIEKLMKLSEVSNGDYTHIFREIFDVYRENIEYGSKYIQYFKCEGRLFNDLYESALSQELDLDEFSRAYPYLVKTDILNNNEINKIHLVKKTENKESLILVYTRIVDFTEKESIDSSEIRDTNIRNQFTEFYGIKKYKKQFIDIVYLNKKDQTIEIRVDYFKNTSDKQMQKYFSDFIFSLNTKIDFTKIFERKIYNIHSIIKKINNDTSGRLVEICFSTKEGSNIRIKKRRLELDIREEAYHKAGSEAVLNNLDIFRIGIVWRNEKNVELELLIPGSSNLVHATHKSINEAIISKCRGAADFNFVNNKVYNFLSDNGSK